VANADHENDSDRGRVDGVEGALGAPPVLAERALLARIDGSRPMDVVESSGDASSAAMPYGLFATEPRLSPALASGRGEGQMQSVRSPMEDCMKRFIGLLIQDEQGQDLIEYGLLIGIITAGAITFINPIGSKVSGYFNNLNNNLP
jgi:Flp pilus assembly pilin Flp